MSEVLGKCPKCGNDVVGGKYGPYCVKKCGFMANKAFGHELTDKEVSDLLEGKEVLLKDCVAKKDGEEHKYDMFVKPDGVEDYPYKKKDGSDAVGVRFKFITRFPEKGEVEEKLGKCPNCGKELFLGKYGAYCSAKCGFMLGKAYGKTLSAEDIKGILTGEEYLLKGLVHKKEDGEETIYDMYVKAVDIETYPYVKKDDTEAVGVRFKFETRFPEDVKDVPEKVSEQEDADPVSSDYGDAPDIELPFA